MENKIELFEILNELNRLSKLSDYPINNKKHYGTYFKYIKPDSQITQADFDSLIESSKSTELTTVFKKWIDEGKGSDLFSQKIVNYFKRKSNSINVFEIFIAIINAFEYFTANKFALWSGLYTYLRDEKLKMMGINDGNKFRLELQEFIDNIALKVHILYLENTSKTNSELILKILESYIDKNNHFVSPILHVLIYSFDISIQNLQEKEILKQKRNNILLKAYNKDIVSFLINIISSDYKQDSYVVWNQIVPKLIGYDDCLMTLSKNKSDEAAELFKFFIALKERDAFYDGAPIKFNFEVVKIEDFFSNYTYESILGVRAD